MAAALAGCGSGAPEFHQLKGNVTFDGKPVVYGTVEFIPNTAKGHHGPAGNADVVEGAYDTNAVGGKGLSKGPHIARVTIFPEKPPAPSTDETVVSKGPTPICIGFPVEVDVQGPELNIDVPAKAKGFDMYKAGRPAGPRPGDP